MSAETGLSDASDVADEPTLSSSDRTPAQNDGGQGQGSVAGQLVGYARVSTGDQILDRQLTELTEAGCSRIFSDHGVSGSKMARPGLTEALDYLRSGDTLVVVELSRLGRNTEGVLALCRDLEQRGVGLRILGLGVDTSTPTGRLVLTLLAAVSEMERELIRERVLSGMAEAKRQGRTGGRPRALTDAQRAVALQQHAAGSTPAEIASLFGCSRRSIERVIAAGRQLLR